MPIYAIGNKVPRIHTGAFIAPTASIVGDVTVHDGASVWYGAVVRGDTSYAVIGAGSNVQDGAVVHGRADLPAIIGKEVTVAHNAIVHGAVVEDRAMVANGAQVLDGAKVGAGSLIAAGSVVLGGTEIPPGMLAVGTPAEVKRPVAGSSSEEWIQGNPGRYAMLARVHGEGIKEVSREECPEPDPTANNAGEG